MLTDTHSEERFYERHAGLCFVVALVLMCAVVVLPKLVSLLSLKGQL